MTPRYESHAIVFPKNLEPYSEESETEQMLQLLQFSEIKDTLVFKFDMYKRWGLKPDEPEYKYWLNLLYEERVRIAPTKYESIKIECQDETPHVAKEMVDAFVESSMSNGIESSLQDRLVFLAYIASDVFFDYEEKHDYPREQAILALSKLIRVSMRAYESMCEEEGDI